MTRGRFVAVEGIDASGKATVSRALAVDLGAGLTSFPRYGTATGRAILGHLRGEWGATRCDLDPLVRQSLMLANRLEAQEDVRRALAVGDLVADRYELSGLVYAEAEGLDRDWLRAVHAPLIHPDLTIVLDIPVPLVALRRPVARDLNERDRGLLERARELYRAACDGDRFVLIDGSGSPDEVLADVRRTVALRLD